LSEAAGRSPTRDSEYSYTRRVGSVAQTQSRTATAVAGWRSGGVVLPVAINPLEEVMP